MPIGLMGGAYRIDITNMLLKSKMLHYFTRYTPKLRTNEFYFVFSLLGSVIKNRTQELFF